MLLEVLAHELTPMDCSSVPQQDDATAHLLQQQAEELDHFHPRDILSVELHVQSPSAAARRNGQSGDGGDPVSPIAMAQQRCLSSRRPGLANGGDQKESCFIEEREMRAEAFRFFLAEATPFVSIPRWPPRLFPWPAALASACSTPDPRPAIAAPPRSNSVRRTASASDHRCVAGSTTR